MVVLVLSACPPGLRGYLTRWLLEISAGVFVGSVSTRVRELMWERTKDMTRTGRVIMVLSARNEQRLKSSYTDITGNPSMSRGSL
ncbi:type I-E CRISPR-associated endoribonuclease Cas2e [Microbacterium luticocti]|uniref:type I-E CRISPR-associated endoribonuclease Cas2e n=1 Tax=Microbacterium luticocti TaxID=451764 RepID=UPI0003FE20DC|nr:type I-E CRISPR-associated endoribonuclease Cas2e [Microbacterium luticocti]